MFGMSELALILLVIAVIVGVKKLPELTRSAGKASRILKSEKRALKEEGRDEPGAPSAAPGSGGRVVTGTIINRDEPPATS
ncbi:twin-arginine translocase TatA/TatE family subunit [Streptomyces sp. NPDC093109]|uniref:twin-arginine translocase TatA/TatE family subunit n=1 Tax=Streptomyces sp. NPDC093109 TaxID=3154977 RepID=UPI0034507FA5